jgi:hypothetical protein
MLFFRLMAHDKFSLMNGLALIFRLDKVRLWRTLPCYLCTFSTHFRLFVRAARFHIFLSLPSLFIVRLCGLIPGKGTGVKHHDQVRAAHEFGPHLGSEMGHPADSWLSLIINCNPPAAVDAPRQRSGTALYDGCIPRGQLTCDENR